jgi:hypothetical protein
MDITTFMIATYCLIDDFLAGQRLRKRGPRPTLGDSEVLTIEVLGEFLGIDTESGIFTHFYRYYADWFPIHPTSFTRQAANLWKVKQELWQFLGQQIPHKSSKREKQPYPRRLTHIRYGIETVFGQLVERFHIKRVWARDLWHLTSRWMRKFLSHTLAVFFCAFHQQPSYLSFATLIHD